VGERGPTGWRVRANFAAKMAGMVKVLNSIITASFNQMRKSKSILSSAGSPSSVCSHTEIYPRYCMICQGLDWRVP